jgi:hypothetical protein
MCRLRCGGAVEDEAHMVFHCGYAPLADIFEATSTGVSDFLQHDPKRLAASMHDCFLAGQ